jgi:hypothetical protein
MLCTESAVDLVDIFMLRSIIQPKGVHKHKSPCASSNDIQLPQTIVADF